MSDSKRVQSHLPQDASVVSSKLDRLNHWLRSHSLSVNNGHYQKYAQRFCMFTMAAVHIYMIFALRASNVDLLEGEDERTWGFGQVIAIFSLGSVVTECIVAIAGMLPVSVGLLNTDQDMQNFTAGRKKHTNLTPVGYPVRQYVS